MTENEKQENKTDIKDNKNNSKEIILDEWQKEALNHEGNLLLCTGRQIGKTYILARKAAERMANRQTKIIIASLTEDQAKLIIVMILDYLESKYRKLIKTGKDKPTQNKINLKNGSSAIARPVGNTGDAIRGFTGDVLILDEVARFNDLIMTAARPTLLSTGGQIWAASTPFGKQGWFWENFQNRENYFKVIYKSSEEAIKERQVNENWTEEKRQKAIAFLENEKKTMSKLRYGQEYEGLFLDDLRRYFDDALIEKVCAIKRRDSIRTGRVYSLGVDIARMGDDESTFEILDKVNEDILEQVENIVTKKTLTTETEERIRELNKIYDFEKIYIDAGAGSLGVGIFDHLLKDENTKRKIVAINNRTRPMTRDGKKSNRLLKEDLYDNLRWLMETGRIRLLDDDEIKASLRSVQFEILGVDEDKDQGQLRIFGNYTHIVEGIIRAAWIVKEKGLNIWVKSIRI